VHIRSTHFASVGALVALITVAVPMSVTGQNESANGEKRCINLRGIDHTEIVDDRNVLFRMRDRVTYRNTLRAECPALRISDKFSYRPSFTLCQGETIDVLARTGSGSIATCALGAFVPVSDDEVKALLAAAAQAANDKGTTRRRTER